MRFRIDRTSGAPDKDPLVNNSYSMPNELSKSYKQFWYIDINSLEELLDLSEKESQELVIRSSDIMCSGCPAIEIYDDWRE